MVGVQARNNCAETLVEDSCRSVHQFGFFSPVVQVLISFYPHQQNYEKWEHSAILGNYPVDRRHIETSLAQPPNLVPLQPDRTEQLSMTE